MDAMLPGTADAPGDADRRRSSVVAWWHGEGSTWTLTLAGDGRAAHVRLPPLPDLPLAATVRVDARQLEGWSAGLAAQLWQTRSELRRRDAVVHEEALPEGLSAVLALAAPQRVVLDDLGPLPTAAVPLTQPPWAVTVTFFGEVLVALWRWLRGRAKVRAADVLHQLDQTGPQSLPIVLLTCALLGLMLAYMAGAQLGRIGAQGFLADVVTVGMVRELAGLMTGIILAGRVGAAFAAQLATMQAGEEIDALRVLGVDPVVHLVLPRLLALLLMAPVLIAFGALAGVLAGWPAAVLAYGVSPAEYLHQSLRALSLTHLSIGLAKGMLYVALVALAGCREGLHAGRSAQAVGAATTAAVVKALVWIVTAACATTVLFTSLGY